MMPENLILDRDAPVLREIAQEIPVSEISSKRIQGVIKKMKDALKSQDDGVAIAAPQIGESLRIFVVSGRAFSLTNKGKSDGSQSEEEIIEDQAYINPVITKTSKTKKKMEEGCLSVRWLYGKVLRSTKVQLKAYDENGNLFERGSSGLLAQIFQHEVDHLNGVLFIDKAEDVEDIPPEKEDLSR